MFDKMFNKNMMDMAQKVLITALAGSAVATGINKAYDVVKLKTDQSNAYKKMFDKVPQLKDYDKATVDDYYDVVKSFAPHMASNPYVAGSIVNKMILNEGVDHRLVGEISEISSKKNQSKNETMNKILGASLAPFTPTHQDIFPGSKGGDDLAVNPSLGGLGLGYLNNK